MSEMTLQPVENWFANGANDSIDFRCPVTKNSYGPDVPPDFMLEDDRMLDGYMALGGVVKDVQTVTWLAQGLEKASDLDLRVLGGPSFEHAVELTSAIGYAALGRSHDGELRRIEIARDIAAAGGTRPSSGSGFLDRITDAAIESTNTTPFYIGIDMMPGDAPQPAGQIERLLTEMHAMAVAERAAGRIGLAHLADLHCRMTEGWYQALAYGYEAAGVASDFEEHQQTLKDSLLVVHVEQLDVPRKLEVSGVDNVGFLDATLNHVTDAIRDDAIIMRTANIPADRL